MLTIIKEMVPVVVTEMVAAKANQENQANQESQANQVNQVKETAKVMEKEPATVQVTETVTATVMVTVTAMVMATAMATVTVMATVTAMVQVTATEMVMATVMEMVTATVTAPDQDQVVLISASQTGHLNGNSIICSVSLTLWPPLIATVKFTLAHLALINLTDTVAHAEI